MLGQAGCQTAAGKETMQLCQLPDRHVEKVIKLLVCYVSYVTLALCCHVTVPAGWFYIHTSYKFLTVKVRLASKCSVHELRSGFHADHSMPWHAPVHGQPHDMYR